MGLFGRKSKAERFRSDPRVEQMIDRIESYGSYDGSSSSRLSAQKVFDKLENHIGCVNPDTKTLYWNTLEATNLPMPLAACYAFARGEYLAMPFYDPIAAGGNTATARMNAEAMALAFPEYQAFVSSMHSSDVTRYIMVLSLNKIDLF